MNMLLAEGGATAIGISDFVGVVSGLFDMAKEGISFVLTTFPLNLGVGVSILGAAVGAIAAVKHITRA